MASRTFPYESGKRDGGKDGAGSSVYNFHDLFSVRVSHPDLDILMRRELSVFLDTSDQVDLTVEEGELLPPERTLSRNYAFDESSLVVDTSTGRIELSEGRIRAESVSPTKLLQWVMALMRPQVLRREVSLVHAAAVSRDGVGYLFPAWTQTGKTNLSLSFLANGYDYMAGDWCFVAASGDLLAYPRYLNLRDYNFRCHPFLLDTLGKRRGGRRLRRYLAAMTFARSLDGNSRFSSMVQRWMMDRYFLNVQLPVSRAVVNCGTSLRAPLSTVCLLTTARSGRCILSEIGARELAEKVVWGGRYERLWFEKAQLAMAYATLGGSPDEQTSLEIDLLTRAFAGAKCVEVTLPPAGTAIDMEQVRALIEGA